MDNKTSLIIIAITLIVGLVLIFTLTGSSIETTNDTPQPTETPIHIKIYPIEPTPTPKPTATPTPTPTPEPSPTESTEDVEIITANITHYCACSKCNGKYSFTKGGKNYTETAIGMILHDGISGNYCAATFGSLGDTITINGTDYKLVDRMKSKSGRKVDIFIADGHDKCLELGRFTADVKLKSLEQETE